MEIKSRAYLVNLLKCCIDNNNKTLLSGKIIHAYILRIGLNNDAFLLNRLLSFYSKYGHIVSARNVFDKNNKYSWHPMLYCYCKAGKLEKMVELFEKMPERDIMSWNMVISAFSRCGYGEKALAFYRTMCFEGLLPNRYTLGSVLSVCRLLEDVDYGRKCHGLGVKIGLEKNVFVGNALLSLYEKGGWVGDAIRVFGDLVEPNEVSFTAIMGALAKGDRVDEAFSMFRAMRVGGIFVDSVLLSSVLAVYATIRRGDCLDNIYGRQIHCLTIKLGFVRDLHLSNSLLVMYVKCGDIASAELVFSDIPRVNIVSWNVMVGGYGQKKEIYKALGFMERMSYEGCQPNEVTYVNILTACANCGDIEIGRRIFNEISCPSVSSWNAIISGYLQIEKHEEAIELFRKMQYQSVRPDRTTLAMILSSCSALGFLQEGKQVHAASYRTMLDSDVYIACGLISLYSNCCNVISAYRIFNRITESDIACWNALMAGLSENSLDKEAFHLFKEMLRQNMYPTQFSYTTALSCCAKVSSLSQGRQVHAQISKHGFENDVFVGSSVIDMHCKCGDVDIARKFFDKMPFINTVTWNGMIHGYAQNGRGDKALDLYESMINAGEKPDGRTFVAVLTGCSHSGLVDSGIKLFNLMELDYGIKPQIDHYTCIIDALGRAGRFDEAKIILDKMPYRDNPLVWEVLLSSCRVHGNVSLAKRAADELLRMDPKSSAPYLLIANMYSAEGRWEEVEDIREKMNDKSVLKNRGYSWILHDNGSVKLEDDAMMKA